MIDSKDTLYLGDFAVKNWNDKVGVEAIVGEFAIKDRDQNLEVLLAYYGYEDYSGSAFVLVRHTKTGELFEVNGSHCSCYGLEGQWDLEPTSKQVLVDRFAFNSMGYDEWELYGDEFEAQKDRMKQKILSL